MMMITITLRRTEPVIPLFIVFGLLCGACGDIKGSRPPAQI
jgi:hypothetical protein